MSDISANRTDLISRRPGDLPSDAHGEKAAREARASALPAGPVSRPPVLGASGRPSEPVTAGLPIGAGPPARPLPSRRDTTVAQLQALARESGDPRVAILLGRLMYGDD